MPGLWAKAVGEGRVWAKGCTWTSNPEATVLQRIVLPAGPRVGRVTTTLGRVTTIMRVAIISKFNANLTFAILLE